MSALNRKLVRDLVRWRGQILAIVAVVACGIASFIAFVSVYDSLAISLRTYYEQYNFADVFDEVTRAPDLVARKLDAVPGVVAVQTRVVREVTIDIPGRSEPATGRLVSVPDEGMPTLNGLYMRSGRYIQPASHGEVIISEAFAAGNDLSLGSTIGAVLNGRWQRLRVVGIAISPEYVYEFKLGDLYPDPKHFGVLWMGQNDVSTAFDMHHAFNDVAVKLATNANEEDVKAQLDRILDRYGGVGAYGRSDQLSAKFLSSELTQLSRMAFLMPAIFLSVAAFLLNVLLMRLVNVQRDQVAVLKAFGYGNLAIGLHYLGFVVVIMLLGALVGAAVGAWWGKMFTGLFTQFFHLPMLRYETTSAAFLEALAISALAAVGGALLAVRSAVSLTPAEAMRPEGPGVYRPTLLERTGIARGLSLTSRIVLRNIERKPMVALLSGLGIAMAIALLMLARIVTEGVDRMADLQFRQVQLEDATVTFFHPLAPAAAYDLASFPGVKRLEPFRSVAARVSYGHVSRKVPILGLPARGELRRILDARLHRVDVPPSGVIITDKLAQVLGVPIGAPITISVLEDRRPTLTMRVVGTVDEPIGMSVYADIDNLGRLLDQRGQISGAFVVLDTLRADDFYQRIKRTPAVAGVTFREASLVNFNQTIANTLEIEVVLILLFASIIAFGVTYNAARISLSERARELSTLRILGFSRRETWRILVGEQVVLAVVAIVPGIAFGALYALLMSSTHETEEFRLHFTISPAGVAFAFLFTLALTAISSFIVRRQIDRLDLVAVLKAGD